MSQSNNKPCLEVWLIHTGKGPPGIDVLELGRCHILFFTIPGHVLGPAEPSVVIIQARCELNNDRSVDCRIWLPDALVDMDDVELSLQIILMTYDVKKINCQGKGGGFFSNIKSSAV